MAAFGKGHIEEVDTASIRSGPHFDRKRIVQRGATLIIEQLQRSPRLAAVGRSLQNDVILGVVATVAPFGEGENRSVLKTEQGGDSNVGIGIDADLEDDRAGWGRGRFLKVVPAIEIGLDRIAVARVER